MVDLGPAPAPEVLAQLLHGSKFNFLILSSAKDPRKLDRVILSPRTEGGVMPLPQAQNDLEDDAPPAPPQAQPGNAPPPPVQNNRPQMDPNNPPDDNTPDQ